jgi:peptidoglycan/xylan/chitin deacetylase (PgdA/CDA1 family)
MRSLLPALFRPVRALMLIGVLVVAPFCHGGAAILAYHRFGQTVADSMTVRVQTFEAQLRYLRSHGYQIVPLHQLVEARKPGAKPLPAKAVAITVDDGHRSVYEVLWPILRRDPFPVTLFIYPSAISHADYAMTWAQLHELQDSGWFDIQSHTYWHPNFKTERRRLSATDYQAFVRKQLNLSRQRLTERFGPHIDLLAWPFGIYDDDLKHEAASAGYVAAFSIDPHGLTDKDEPYAMPRFLMVDTYGEKAFARLLSEAENGLPAKPNQP